jgi:hypothetical protein
MTDHPSPNEGNLTIGKGELWVKPFGSGTYESMGYCTEVTMETEVEKLAFYDPTQELRSKVKEVTIESNMTVTLTANEITRKNIAKYTQGQVSGDQVYFLEGVTNEYTLKYITNNPAGPNATYFWHRGTFSPNGAQNLISEEFGSLQIQFEVLNDATNNPTNPMGYVQFTTTTTTTTTA